MNGRDNQRNYVLGSHPGGRIIVPPRHEQRQAASSSYAVPQQPLVNKPRVVQPSPAPASSTTSTASHVSPQPNGALRAPIPGQQIIQSSSKQVAQTKAPGAPYNQRHLPTSNPEPYIESNPTISFSAIASNSAKLKATDQTQQATNSVTTAKQPTSSPSPQGQPVNAAPQTMPAVSNGAKQQTASNLTPAQKRYHQAWQNYYQKYYENYYIAALQEQKARFAKQQAEVVDSRESDGKLSQSEVQERIQSDIIDKVKESTGKAKKRWWFWPIIVAIIVALAFLFLQYNSVIIAAITNFTTPGTSAAQTIIIGTGDNQPVSDNPRVIIPKINVNAPVIYGLTDLSEGAVQTALENGPINYPITGASATPGQKGNTVILGHSSGDIFAPGNYKLIFSILNRIAVGDMFYLDYGAKRYSYKVTEIKTIAPTDVGALNLGTDKPYATLVTCDPPGRSWRRLLVIGEQVSPDPNASTEVQDDSTTKNSPSTITGKPKTLLENIFGG